MQAWTSSSSPPSRSVPRTRRRAASSTLHRGGGFGVLARSRSPGPSPLGSGRCARPPKPASDSPSGRRTYQRRRRRSNSRWLTGTPWRPPRRSSRPAGLRSYAPARGAMGADRRPSARGREPYRRHLVRAVPARRQRTRVAEPPFRWPSVSGSLQDGCRPSSRRGSRWPRPAPVTARLRDATRVRRYLAG
jgi:hypothetical protein